MNFAKEIHAALFSGNSSEALEKVFEIYEEKSVCIGNFLYFANAHFQGLYRGIQPKGAQNYFRALLSSDIILPDGIALSLVHYARMHPEESKVSMIAKYTETAKKSLHNLNGTDFIPKLLEEAKRRYGANKIRLVLYGAFSHIIPKAADYFSKTYGFETCFLDGYSPFDAGLLENPEWKITILLVGQGSPRQELFVESNRVLFTEKKVIVFTVGGLFDFFGGFEKRAPEWVRNIRAEWLWRLFSNPKKNFRKVMASFYSFREVFSPGNL